MKKLINLLKEWREHSEYTIWLWKYTKPYIPQILFLLLIGFADSSIYVYLAVVTKNIIDSAMDGKMDTNGILIYIAMVLITLLISAATTLVGVMLEERFSFGIRKQIYRKIIESKWMEITKYHTGDMMTRLTSDAGNVSNGIIYTIPNIINLIVQLIITFAILYYYEPTLAVLALLIAPVAAVTSFWLGRKLKFLQVKVQESESAYRSFLQESLSNLLIVKAFTNEDFSTNKLIELRDERFSWVRKKSRMSVAGSTIISLTFQLGYIAAFTFGSVQVSAGLITYGTMTVFLTLVNRVQSPIVQLAQSIPQIVSILASTGRIVELQDIPAEEVITSQITNEKIGIEIKDLSFGYHQDEILFENAAINIKPGEFVAIVGESGIGKTTLIRIIMSFINEANGMVEFVNEEGKREVANAGSREFITYVPQGNTLFSGTIRANILMGNVEATDEEIYEVLRMSSAEKFVSELPKGIDTIIGERGMGISEGQAQRIGIARALIKKAPFIILDEATSSLDDLTELSVLGGIRKLHPRPTCLLITHRHSVLDYCDREIRIEDKKLITRSLNAQ